MGVIKLPSQSIKFFERHYTEIFSSGNLAEGKWNKRVSEWGSEFTSAPFSLAFNSNGSGLFTILRLLKRYRGKKNIFLQSNTMYGVKTIAVSSGLELKGFVDCSLDYLMPTLKQVEIFVNNLKDPQNSVFLLTHIGGWINPDIKEIASLCSKKGISLVEDCAHSLGSILDNNHSGLYGLAGVYSLYATKAVPAGEGGLMVTKDEELYEMSKRFIMYDRFEQQIDVGINLRMSEINALLSFSVLKETESIIENKYLVAKKFIDQCNTKSLDFIDPLELGHRSNLYKFILLAKNDDQLTRLKGLKTKTSSVYDYSLGSDPYEIALRHICLPIWYDQDSETTNKVLAELDNI
jgi:dTDP-4-amino-4,6-dideoxygalactose transaminase